MIQSGFKRRSRGVYKYFLCLMVFFALPVIMGGALAGAIETLYIRRGLVHALIFACLSIYLMPIGISVLARCRAETEGQLFGRHYFLNGQTFLSAVATIVMLVLYCSAGTMDIFVGRLTLEFILLVIASSGLEMVQGEMQTPMDRYPKPFSPRLQEQLENLKKLYRRKYLAEYLKDDLKNGRI